MQFEWEKATQYTIVICINMNIHSLNVRKFKFIFILNVTANDFGNLKRSPVKIISRQFDKQTKAK